MHRCDDVLDLLCGSLIEARGRFVEKDHLGRKRPGAGEGEPLLFASREGFAPDAKSPETARRC